MLKFAQLKGGEKMSADRLTEAEDIKRLLILLLFKLGATSQEIGEALRVDSSVIRKMMPVRNVKKVELFR